MIDKLTKYQKDMVVVVAILEAKINYNEKKIFWLLLIIIVLFTFLFFEL